MRAAGRLTATPAGTIELVEPRSGYEGSCRAHGNDGRAIGGILARIGDKWSLLVIGTRRRTPVGKLIMAPTTQRLLLEAGCPVLCVKAEYTQD